MRLVQRSLALVCLVLLFIFCVSNGEPVSVRFLAWESIELPIFLLLIFAFLTGAVLALLGQSLRSVTRSTDKQVQKDQKVESKQNTTTDILDLKPELDGSIAEKEGDK